LYLALTAKIDGGVSEWLLLYANWAIFYDENKLPFDEKIMMSVLY